LFGLPGEHLISHKELAGFMKTLLLVSTGITFSKSPPLFFSHDTQQESQE
jgi:hypothetical protein